MAVAVKDFKYTIKTDGDLWYTLDLEEFNLLNYEDQNNAAVSYTHLDDCVKEN